MDIGLLRLVDRQGGVFTREQALDVCTPVEVRAKLRRGEWQQTPWRGIYRDGELPADPRIVIRAASLWLGGDVVACQSTAALLWNVDLRSDTDVATGDLHFLAPGGVDNRRLNRLWLHPSCLGTDDAVQRHGVWCTPPARTVCEVARLGRPIDVLATLDLALRKNICTQEDLAAERVRQRGLRGIELVGHLIPHASPDAESAMESRTRWRFLDAGLPAPTVQVRVTDGRRLHRLDMGWEEELVGVEFDGLEAHMTAAQLAADRDRHNWLTAERRWLLLHFTARDVYRRYELMVATTTRHLRSRRSMIMAL